MSSRLYHVYGDRIRSGIPLPELRPATGGSARWHFSVADHLEPIVAGEVMGEEHIYANVSATLVRHPNGFRIDVPDTGAFQIDSDLAHIHWQPNADPWWDFGRSHLLGRVLSTCLHFSGILTLHGSAVELGDGVVAFLAPSYFGKTTLARSLVAAGGRLVTDDTLPIEVVKDHVMARPGVQAFRVEGGSSTGRDGKHVVTEGHTLTDRPTKVSAVYLLETVPSLTNGEPFSRLMLHPSQAVIGMMGRTKIGEMLGVREAPVLMRRVAEVAQRVPVTSLAVVRNFDLLSEVVAALISRHGLPEAAAAQPVR